MYDKDQLIINIYLLNNKFILVILDVNVYNLFLMDLDIYKVIYLIKHHPFQIFII